MKVLMMMFVSAVILASPASSIADCFDINDATLKVVLVDGDLKLGNRKCTNILKNLSEDGKALTSTKAEKDACIKAGAKVPAL